MIHYNHFIMAESLDEAYELNRKKSAVICGGFCWLRLQNRTVQTMIDLSGLGLDQIEETEEGFEIRIHGLPEKAGNSQGISDVDKRGGS